MTWRTWLGFCGTGCAAVFAYRGDWRLTAVGAVAVLVPVALWMRREWAAAAEVIRRPLDPEPPPAPALEPFPAPRIRREPHPPWDTAQQPVVPAELDSDGLDAAGRHRAKRGLREAVDDALRAAKQAYLP